MKKYTIRFHKAHDLDIISIFEDYRFDIIKAIYCALTAFCNGDVFAIKIPEKREQSYHIKRRIYCRHLKLNEKKDVKAIALLDRISKGYRNNFLKNLLRMYLCMPVSFQFFENPEDAEMVMNMFAIFRRGRRLASAADINNYVNKKVRKPDKRKLKALTNSSGKGKTSKSDDATKEKAEMISAFEEEVDLGNVSPDQNDDAELTDLFSEMLKK